VNSSGICVAVLCTSPLLFFLIDELRNETHIKLDSCETGTGKGETIPKTYNVNMRYQISPKHMYNLEYISNAIFRKCPRLFLAGTSTALNELFQVYPYYFQ
jgi:hypothetical protein